MARYKGFNCDSCGKVVDESQRTKKRTSFEGPAADGSYTEDLCPECVVIPDGVNYKKTKRRGGNLADKGVSAPANGEGAVQDATDAFVPPGIAGEEGSPVPQGAQA